MQKPSNLPAVDHTLPTSISSTPRITGSFAVRGSISAEINRIVYFGEESLLISEEYIILTDKMKKLLEIKHERSRILEKQINLLDRINEVQKEIDKLRFLISELSGGDYYVFSSNFNKLYDHLATIQILMNTHNELDIEKQLIENDVQVIKTKDKELNTEVEKLTISLYGNKGEKSTNKDVKIEPIGAQTPVKIEIKTVSRQEDDLSNPQIKAAVEKFLSFKNEVQYQTAKGRAAKPVDKWIQATFIDSGKMSAEEIRLIPMWAYQEFDSRLARAFHNARRYQKT